MTKVLVIFAFWALTGVDQAAAQFVKPIETTGNACQTRRDMEPEYFKTFDFREAYRVILIQRMYTAQAMSKIVETGNCSCETRFPDWDPAITYYKDHYAMESDRFKIDDLTSYYEGVTNSVRTEARAICVTEGNW